MFENASNTKKQGDIGLGSAIAHFTKMGFTVCLPLTDSQDYDLVVEVNDKLSKVQIKTSSNKTAYNEIYTVGLRVLGGNQSWNGVAKHFDNTKVDYLFILLSDGRKYFIPTNVIDNKSSINIGGEKYKEYEC